MVLQETQQIFCSKFSVRSKSIKIKNGTLELHIQHKYIPNNVPFSIEAFNILSHNFIVRIKAANSLIFKAQYYN